jgi:7-cyano-7-deazaguanine synthase
MSSSCVVVFSGGQDSTTCLFWARERFSTVQTLTFDYGQRHRIELDCAQEICQRFGFAQEIIPIDTFAKLGGNSLTDAAVPVQNDRFRDLPTTFVPGRNLIFLTFAAAWAWKRGINDLITGTGEADYSGYPDCRESTLKSLEQTLNLGMEGQFKIHAPLTHLSKADTVRLAQQVGALEALAYSHTCYNGQQPPCGVCDSCKLRAKGFAEAGVADPLIERLQNNGLH